MTILEGGYIAVELAHEVIAAMKAGDGMMSNLARTVHIHPTLSEIVQRAAFSA